MKIEKLLTCLHLHHLMVTCLQNMQLLTMIIVYISVFFATKPHIYPTVYMLFIVILLPGVGGNNTKKLFYKVRKRTDDWLLPTATMTTQHRQRNRHELVGRPPHWRHRGMTGRGQVVTTAPPHGS